MGLDRADLLGVGGDRFQFGAFLVGRGALVGEHVVEFGRHEGALFFQAREQGGHVGQAHHVRHELAVRLERGQGVGLGVVQVLQAVLQVAQEGIGFQQPFDGGGRHQLALGQQAQGLARGAFAQGRVAPAAYQLEDLGQEFDLADAAAPQLDVVAAVRMQAFLAFDFGADLGVHVADGVDHAEVEVAPEHKRPHDGVQGRDVFLEAGDGARLDPGIALPFAPLHDQVLFHHVQAGRQRTGLAVRAQRHVDPEGKAVLDHFRQRADQLAAQAHEELVVRQRALAGAGGGFAVFRIHEDQIDVRGDVQFAAALLAHGQYHHFLGPPGFGADRHAVGRHLLGHQVLQVGADREVGQAGHGGDDFVEIGQAFQVAPDQACQQEIAQAAHGARQGNAGRQLSVQ